MVAVTKRTGGLWQRFLGSNEAADRPLLAAESDSDVALWRDSKQVPWTCNTMVLKTISARLRDDVEGPTS